MKFGRWKILLSWKFGLRKGIFPRDDYVMYDWWLIGFIKIIKNRKRGERT